MLKRADLLKQLELSIQQEIKNYNDSLSSILLRLNYLKEDIDKAERESLENDAVISNQIKELEIKLYHVGSAREDSYKRTMNSFTQLEQKCEQLKVDVGISLSNALEANRISEHNRNSMVLLAQRVETLEDEITGFTTHIHHKVEGLAFQLKKDVSRAKDEILSIPSEAKQIKQELEEKINSHAVDVEGLLKEIRVSNKAMMVLEKKIENLYTLVGRLQKSEVKP